MKPIWGIDLGGTKIEGIIVDADNRYATITRLRVPTEQQKGYAHIVSQIGRLVQLMKQESGLTPSAIGIGTPGAMDPQLGTLKNSNTTCLNGQPLQPDVQRSLGLPVTMANDANCFALAETRLGVIPDRVPDAQMVFGVIMGTGVGGGLVVHNQIIAGLQGIAGEWGHNFLHESGGPCYCGRVGCTETVLSGTGLQKYYAFTAGSEKKLQDIVADARSGSDPHAVATLDRLLEFFGKGIATIINLLDPDAVIIGGGVGNIDELYDRGAREVEKQVFNHRMYTPILKPKLGDSAGVYGAAMLVE